MVRTVFCKKLGKEAEGLEEPPYPGENGLKIYNSISRAAWESWLQQQTMLINEYRLSLIDKKSREFLESEMKKFLFEGISKKPPKYTEED